MQEDHYLFVLLSSMNHGHRPAYYADIFGLSLSKGFSVFVLRIKVGKKIKNRFFVADLVGKNEVDRKNMLRLQTSVSIL